MNPLNRNRARGTFVQLALIASLFAMTTTNPAAVAETIATTTPAAVAAPSVLPGVYEVKAYEADDATLKVAREYGLSDTELGIGAGTEHPTSNGETAAPAAAAAVAPSADAGTGTVAETPEQKIARLEKELAEAKNPAANEKKPDDAARSQEQTPPVPAAPVEAGVFLGALNTASDFEAAANTARQIREWARANSQGGDMPVALVNAMNAARAKVLGEAAPAAVTETKYFEAKGAAQLFEQADAMISQHLPARREFLQQEREYFAHIAQESPDVLKPDTALGKTFNTILSSVPALRHLPDWPLMVRDMAAGSLLYYKKAEKAAQESGASAGAGGEKAAAAGATSAAPAAARVPAGQAQAPTAKTPEGVSVPLAPAAPTGGLAAGGVPVTQKQIDDATARMNKGEATEADWLVLSHAAI